MQSERCGWGLVADDDINSSSNMSGMVNSCTSLIVESYIISYVVIEKYAALSKVLFYNKFIFMMNFFSYDSSLHIWLPLEKTQKYLLTRIQTTKIKSKDNAQNHGNRPNI